MAVAGRLDAWRDRGLAVTGVVVAAWTVAVLRPVIADTVVPWDSKNQFYAFFRFLAATLHQGVAPFWNPYHYAGHPSVADPQSLIFAPAFFVWGLLDEAPSMRAFDLVVSAHLLIGGLCIAAIGRRDGWPASARVLAAVLFMLGGAAAGRLQHTGLILSYALFPPALLLLQTALRRRSVTIGIAFAVVASVLALGRNQVALLLCFVLLAAGVTEIVRDANPLACLRSRAPVLAVTGIVGMALCAAPVLLTLQFAALSNRPVEALDIALKGSLYPPNLATFAVADAFGSHSGYWGPGAGRVPDVAFTDGSFNYLFIGAGATVLLLWLGVACGGAWRPGRRFVAATAVVALLYMLGRYTPLFALAHHWVPGVGLFRRPVDASFVLAAMLPLIVGPLLSDYIRDGLPPLRPVAAIATVAGAVVILAWAALFSYREGHGVDCAMAMLEAAPGGIAVALALGLAQRRKRAAALVAAVIVAELLWWNPAFRLNAEPRALYAVLEQPAARDAQALAVLESALAERHAAGARPRVGFLGLGGPWQNIGMVRGIEAINGYNPLRIGDYDRLVAPGEENWSVALRQFPPTFASYDAPLAHGLGLEFLALDRPVTAIPNLGQSPKADVLRAGSRLWIYRLHPGMPRAGFAGGASIGSARITAWRADRVEIEAEAKDGGILVLRDPYYPGWAAEIDGKETPIKQVGHLFRAVDFPPGRHTVRFRFAPFAWRNLRDALTTALTGQPRPG